MFYTGIKPKVRSLHRAQEADLLLLLEREKIIYGTNRYPTPRMVMICWGVRALSSILLRRRLM